MSGESWSDSQITITANTTIDLNGNMLYHRPGSVESFVVVQNNATLTIEDSGEDSGRVVDHPEPFTGEPGQPATMTWTGNNNGTPQSLTYYETTSTPNEDKLGTTETTTKHVVSGFGAIVAASDGGSVKRVISVADGSTLNLNGGMITTPRNLGHDGHVILSQGAVNISGGYVTNGSGGGWGGGLCVTGVDASLVMTGGVIAGNKAASGGGIFANNGATLELSGGVISGNATYPTEIYNGDDVNAGGYGGGVYTQGASVTISDSANITNNRAEARIANEGYYNKGRLGGGGIASMNGGTLSMTGGSVTANYSYEAGGGIYAGFPGQGFGFAMFSGFIAGNKSDNAEGGGLRISGGTTGDIGVSNTENASNRVYITNNKTMTGSNPRRGGDWGGGGVFVQEGGTLNIVKTLITNNKAGGWAVASVLVLRARQSFRTQKALLSMTILTTLIKMTNLWKHLIIPPAATVKLKTAILITLVIPSKITAIRISSWYARMTAKIRLQSFLARCSAANRLVGRALATECRLPSTQMVVPRLSTCSVWRPIRPPMPRKRRRQRLRPSSAVTIPTPTAAAS